MNYIIYTKLAVNEDVISPVVHFHANMFPQSSKKAVPLWADLRWTGREFHILLADKRKYLDPDDFTYFLLQFSILNYNY